MAEENLRINFGESGAELVGSKIRTVTRDYQKLQDLFAKGFTVGNNVQGGGSGSLFDPKWIQDLGNKADDASKKVFGLQDAMKLLKGVLIAGAIHTVLEHVVDLTDEFTSLENKVRAVSDSLGQSQIVMKELINVAVNSRTALDNVVTTYSRMTRAVEEMGKSQQTTIQFTETLAKAVQVGGSTTLEASNALLQLDHGMSTGTLRGRELRSVLAQLPVVAKLIADHMGITVSQLREFGKEGKLTSDQVFDAILEGQTEIDEKFKSLTPTFAQGWEVFKTKGLEASKALQPAVTLLAESLIKMGDGFHYVATALELMSEDFKSIEPVLKRITELVLHLTPGALDEDHGTSAWEVSKFVAKRLAESMLHLDTGALDFKRVDDRIKRDDEGQALMAMNDTSALDPKANTKIHHAVTPTPGKSFADLQRELQDGLGVLKVGMLQIREAGSGITLPSQRKKADLQLAGPEDMAVAKRLESTIDQLGKKQPRLNEKQKDALADLIRQQEAITLGKKEQLEIEKSIDHELDERLKVEVALIEAQDKKSSDLSKQVEEEHRQSLRQQDTAYRSIQQGLDPNFDTKAQIAQLEQFRDNPKTIHEEAVKAQLAIDNLNYSMSRLATTFAQVGDNMVQGFSDAIARAIVLNENIGDLMRNLMKMITMQAISGLVSTGLNAGISGLSGLMTGANLPSTIGTTVLPGHAAGGYTGDLGTHQAAGIVHGREYVLNAEATSRIGVGALNAMNSGASPGGGPKIVINNTASGDGYNARVGYVSRDEVHIMIDKGIAEKAPQAVAGAMHDKNSVVTKSMRANFDINARNI